MARVGWAAARRDDPPDPTGTPTSAVPASAQVHWFRLSVFDDGWVEVPGFGRAVAGIRDNARRAYRTLGLVVPGVVVGILLLVWANSFSGTAETVLRTAGLVLTVASIVLLSARSLSLDVRKNARQWADTNDLQRLKAAGRLPARVPGTPLFRPASSAEEFASRLTNTTLVRAADVSSVTSRELVGDALTPVDGPYQLDELPYLVEVRLHSGELIRYRSPEAKLGTLLSRFGVASPHTAG